MQPSTRAGLGSGSLRRPANLLSHTDQTLAQQSADGTGFTRIGWGGRIADRLDAINAPSLFPALVSTNSLRVSCSGDTSIPLAVQNATVYGLSGSGDTPAAGQFDALREAAMRELASHARDNLFDEVGQTYAD